MYDYPFPSSQPHTKHITITPLSPLSYIQQVMPMLTLRRTTPALYAQQLNVLQKSRSIRDRRAVTLMIVVFLDTLVLQSKVSTAHHSRESPRVGS